MLEKGGTKNLEQNENALQKPTTEGVICPKKHQWTKYLNPLYLLWTNFPCKIFAEFRVLPTPLFSVSMGLVQVQVCYNTIV